MRIDDTTLDRALELSLKDLRENLKPGKESAGEKIGKVELLLKARTAFREGKISLVEAGNIEGRINKGRALESKHMAILGLKPGDKIQGLEEPAISSVASRMGEKAPPGSAPAGKPVTQIGAWTPAPDVNPIVAEMNRGQTLLHNFQQPDNSVMTVSGSEILRRCAELVKSNKMSLMRAGDIERMTNSGLPIRPEVLREIFV